MRDCYLNIVVPLECITVTQQIHCSFQPKQSPCLDHLYYFTFVVGCAGDWGRRPHGVPVVGG